MPQLAEECRNHWIIREGLRKKLAMGKGGKPDNLKPLEHLEILSENVYLGRVIDPINSIAMKNFYFLPC